MGAARKALILGVAVLTTAALASCGKGNVEPILDTPPSGTATSSAATPPSMASPLSRQTIQGVPFDVLAPQGAGDQVQVIRAGQGPLAAEGTDYQVSGQTAPVGNRPGPSVAVVLSDGNAFGSLMIKERVGELVDLSDLESANGIIAPDGTFTDLSAVPGIQPFVGLSGSNPQDLYFEPQHASAFGEWVVWREASAGKPNAIPNLDTDDWRVIAWNRTTGTQQEMASAFLTHGNRFAPYSTWDVAPSTDGTNLYYEAMLPSDALTGLANGALLTIEPSTTNQKWTNSVISVPLDSPGEVHFVATGSMPIADVRSGDGVYLIDTQVNPTVKHNTTDQASDLFGIAEGPGWNLIRLAGSDRLLVATVISETDQGTQAWLLVWDLMEERLAAAIDTGSDWAEASVSGGSFVWGNATANGDPTMYYWKLGLSQPVQLGKTQGLSVPLIKGSTVVLPVLSEENAVLWQFLQWGVS